MHVLIVGSGPMACEYSKVLTALHIPFTVVGRGQQSAQQFATQTGLPAITGGYEHYLQNNVSLPSHAIIAVGERGLGEATRKVIAAGIRNILVEKPGGIDAQDICAVADCAKQHQAKVYVGYNRRFYASVTKAKAIIAEDGGLLSFNFEFTEWGHIIADLAKEEGVKENWFMANSSHVIDLAFYIGGAPKTMNCYQAGRLVWHPHAAIYAGSGMTKTGALFTYQANWQAPGRWGLEFLTAKHRLYLRPLEKLQLQEIGSVAIEPVNLDDTLDQDFKAGLYAQTCAFIQQPACLLTIAEQVNNLTWYAQINQHQT